MNKYSQKWLLKKARQCVCVFCGSQATSYDEFDIETPHALQIGKCRTCQGQWREVYLMKRIEMLIFPVAKTKKEI